MTDKNGQPAETAEDFSLNQADLFKQGFSFSGYERDVLSWNRGNGTFLDISGISGADAVGDGRGSVFADFDNDGDLDLFTTSMHGPAHHLYRNNVGSESNFIRVAVRGTTHGRDGFGAEVRIKSSAGIQSKVVAGGSGFISQSDPRLLFGLGQDQNAQWVEVRWPSGTVQRFGEIAASSSIVVTEGEQNFEVVDEQRFTLPDRLSEEELLWRRLGLERGQSLQDVPVHLVGGETRLLSDVAAEKDGIVLSFWATWCRNCAREMPEIDRMYHDGLQVLGISVDDAEGVERIPAFVERLGVSYPIATIEAEALGILFATRDLALPLTVVVDRDLKPVSAVQGWSASLSK